VAAHGLVHGSAALEPQRRRLDDVGHQEGDDAVGQRCALFDLEPLASVARCRRRRALHRRAGHERRLDDEEVVDRVHAPEEVDVVRGQEAPRGEVGCELALTADVRRGRDEKPELGHRQLIQAHRALHLVADDGAVLLVGVDGHVHQLQEVAEVGLRLVIPLQLLDRKHQLEVGGRPVGSVGAVGAVRPGGLGLGPEERGHGLEAVGDRKLARRQAVDLAHRRPSRRRDEMVRGHVLVQPGSAREHEVEVQGDLQKVDGGAIELGDDAQRVDVHDLDVTVETGRLVGAIRAVVVGEQLHRHHLAVIAEPDARLGDARPGPSHLGGVDHVDVTARAPGALDGRAEV
jgi:hypothetical protein